MKTIELNLFSAAELKEQFPDGWEMACENWRRNQPEVFWQDEIIDSFKAVFKSAGIRLKNWEIGGSGTDCTIEFSQDEAGDISGKRAFAWIENNLLSKFRIPFYGKRRWEVAKYGACYRPGMISPCPLTGYCADEDFIDAIKKSIRKGDTLKEAFENLASVAAKLIEDESESQSSEDYFLDHAMANEYQFTEDGEIY